MTTVALLRLCALAIAAACSTTAVFAQDAEPTSRRAVIENEQTEKDGDLHPYVPNAGERLMARVERALVNSGPHFHPFFDSAYRGGGFAFGAGYTRPVSSYNLLDVRASYTISGYKRAEAEFIAPRLFRRRGSLTLLGGWREATQVAFYGIGTNTSVDDRTNYRFQQPHASALLTVRPTRRLLLLQAGGEWSRWTLRPGQGAFPPVEFKYTPQTLPGVGTETTYLHTQGTAGFDWRTSPGYSRRGGFYGVTFHDYHDTDGALGFKEVDYEAIQHIPILREAWAISLHALVRTTLKKSGGQQVPFFMLPSLGGGTNLRGFSSWRFRDRNSMLLQGEWRIMVNRFLDTVIFYDTGKVTASTADFDFEGLKSDFGIGLRFHGPISTPLRMELAKGNEGLVLIFATSHVF